MTNRSSTDSHGPLPLDPANISKRAKEWFQETRDPDAEKPNIEDSESLEQTEGKENNSSEQEKSKAPEPTLTADDPAEGTENRRGQRIKKRPSWLKEFILAESH